MPCTAVKKPKRGITLYIYIICRREESHYIFYIIYNIYNIIYI